MGYYFAITKQEQKAKQYYPRIVHSFIISPHLVRVVTYINNLTDIVIQ